MKILFFCPQNTREDAKKYFRKDLNHFAALNVFRGRNLLFFLICLFLLPISNMCQIIMPKPEEIASLETDAASMFDWYQSDELLKLIPEFIATDGTYATKALPFQRGRFILKNGGKINWTANSKDTILLLDGVREQLFVRRKEDAPRFPKFLCTAAAPDFSYPN